MKWLLLVLLQVGLRAYAADFNKELACCKAIGCNMTKGADEKIIVYYGEKQTKGFYTFSNSMCYFHNLPKSSKLEDVAKIEDGPGITKEKGKHYTYKLEVKDPASGKSHYYQYNYIAEVSERELSKAELHAKHIVAPIDDTEKSITNFKESQGRIDVIKSNEALSKETRKILTDEMAYQLDGFFLGFEYPTDFTTDVTSASKTTGRAAFIAALKQELTDKHGRTPTADEMRVATEKGIELSRKLNEAKLTALKACEQIPELKVALENSLKEYNTNVKLAPTASAPASDNKLTPPNSNVRGSRTNNIGRSIPNGSSGGNADRSTRRQRSTLNPPGSSTTK